MRPSIAGQGKPCAYVRARTRRGDVGRFALATILLLALPLPALAAPAPEGGVLAAALRAPTVVLARVRSVAKEEDRVEVAKLKVIEPIRGEAKGTIRAAHRRAFASDPSPFREGAFVAAALAPMPTQSYWRRRFEGKDVLFLPSPAYAREIAEADLARWRAALAEQRELADKDDAPGLARFYLATAALPPAALAGDALRALGALTALADLLGAREIEALRARLLDRRIDRDARRDLVRALASRKVAAAAPALVALAEEDAALRAEALSALAALGREDKSARAAALAGLDRWAADPDPAVRRGAADLLAASLDEESIPRLTKMAVADPDDEVAVAAVDGLARLGGDDPRFYDAMGAAGREARIRPAARAAAALGKAGTAKSVETLETFFAGERYEAQAAAVIALTNIPLPQAAEAIRRVHQTTPSPKLRKAIERILGQGMR